MGRGGELDRSLGHDQQQAPSHERQDALRGELHPNCINAGANDEIFSTHPGGANILFGDGRVQFVKDSTNPVVLRSLVTYQGKEVISPDAY